MSHATAIETNEEGRALPARAPIRVLVVDEHSLVRAGLRWMLDGEPEIEIVAEASSGPDAVRLAKYLRPDVVVMGVDMAADGGMTATRALTASEPHPAVIALTLRSDDERVVEMLRAGASGYLTKNLERDELIAALHTAVEGGIHVQPHVGRLLAATLRRRTAPSPQDQVRAKFRTLSEREQAVLQLVAEGNSGPQIGRQLGITAKTVDTYRHRIREKLGLAQRTDYLRFALSLGLFPK